MDDVIYENEVLPELEIEEVLTLEQMLEFQPRFVAFREQDMLAYIQQLLKSTPQRAEMFARLHKQVVIKPLSNHKESTAPHTRVTYRPLGLTRKNFEDANFVGDMNEAKQASSYAVQQMGVDRVMFPFALDDDVSSITLTRPTLEHDATIMLANGSYSHILANDPLQVHVEAARWDITPANTHPDYVFDAPLPMASPQPQWIEWKEGESLELAEWILKRVRPAVKDMLRAITEPLDIHTLHRILAKYGHDLTTLSITEFEALQQHMRGVFETSTAEPDASDDTTSAIAPSKFTTQFVSLPDTLTSETTRAMMLKKDDAAVRMEQAYFSMLQSIPPLPPQIPLPSPAEIAKDLQSGSVTMETIAEQLIHWYMRWFLDNLSRFMDRYTQTHIEMDQVDRYVRRLQNVGGSIMLTSTFDFINRYSDVAEVKEGNDTSMYDGTPSLVPETVFEENANEEYIQNIVNDEEEDTSHLYVVDNESFALPLDELALSPGQKESIMHAWNHICIIQQASGLPLDAQSVLRWCKQYIQRPSRVQQIMAKVQGISEMVASRIVNDRLEVALERIQDLHSKEWRDALLASYKEIQFEWLASWNETLRLIMTRWWIELCWQSVQGTLHFTPLQGMVRYIHMWGAYGPPMQPDAKSGILHYLVEVAQFIVSGLDARSFKEEMKNLAVERMAKDLEDLQVAWEKLQASGHIMNQSERARLLLENTIKALKNKQTGVDVLGGFLPGMIYLPQLLPHKRISKKAASWIQGCCAAPLDETFQADNDWRTQLSALYKIKRFLAKERWSVQARSVLNGFSKDTDKAHMPQESRPCSQPVTTEELEDARSASDIFGINLQDECWQWIPRSHMDMLTKQPNMVEGWAKGLIEKMYPSEKNKSAAVFRALSQITSMSSLISFLNRIGKNVQETSNNAEMAELLSRMKMCLRNVPSGKVSYALILYVSTITLGLPATIEQGQWSIPPHTTRQELSAIWNKHYHTCTEWNQIGVMMNANEVQSFITKVREQQKEISLQRLDVLSIEDRQILLDAKNLGLLRIVEFSEIHVDAALDLEGEQDFAMPSLDADPDEDALL